MATVAQIVKGTKQPYGGLVPLKDFTKTVHIGVDISRDGRNVDPTLLGVAVEALTLLKCFGPEKDIFFNMSSGMFIMKNEGLVDSPFRFLVPALSGGSVFDNNVIQNVLQAAAFEAVYRVGPKGYIKPAPADDKTLSDIKILLSNSELMFNDVDSPIVYNFEFDGAYTDLVTIGEGDFLTSDTLWDMKVSINKPNKNHILQVLIYFLLGKKSGNKIFDNITHAGIFNPLLHATWRINVSDISKETVYYMAREIIGYSIETSKELSGLGTWKVD